MKKLLTVILFFVVLTTGGNIGEVQADGGIREQAADITSLFGGGAADTTDARELGENARNLGHEVLEVFNFKGKIDEVLADFENVELNTDTLKTMMKAVVSREDVQFETQFEEQLSQVIGLTESDNIITQGMNNALKIIGVVVFFKVIFALLKHSKRKHEIKYG